MPAREHHVLGLDVAVHHTVAVRFGQGIGHVAQDPHGIGHRQGALTRDPVAEGCPLDERHDVEQVGAGRVRPSGGTRVVERQDVGVLQRRGDADLTEEAVGAHRRGQIGLEHLHRHLAVVPQILRQVDGGHAAGTRFALDAVAASQRLVEAGNDVGQGALRLSGDDVM